MNEEIKKFIVKEIDSLSLMFPLISFKYGYDEIGEQHIIDIEPDTEYRNEEYMLAEFTVLDKFITQFPEEQLLFVSNDNYIKVDKPIYVKEGYISIINSLITGFFAEKLTTPSRHCILAPISLVGFEASSVMGKINVVDSLIHNNNNKEMTVYPEADVADCHNLLAA